MCLLNYVVVVAVSLKSRVHVFGKSYYENIVVLCNDQNRYTFVIAFYFMFNKLFRHFFLNM